MNIIKNLQCFSFLLIRTWTVEGGLDGETCGDFRYDDDELWCSYVLIPPCVDRTIRCSTPPKPEKAIITILDTPNPKTDDEMGTQIEYSCPDRLHYFDYPVEEPFISFYYTTNINFINVSCNYNGEWEVYGGEDGLTCDDTEANSTELTCGPLSIPDCVDRTVYCVNTPTSIYGGTIIIDENPSPYYKKRREYLSTELAIIITVDSVILFILKQLNVNGQGFLMAMIMLVAKVIWNWSVK